MSYSLPVIPVHSLTLGAARMVVAAFKADSPDPYHKGADNRVLENIHSIKTRYGMMLVTDDELVKHRFNVFAIHQLTTDAGGKVTVHGVVTDTLGHRTKETLEVEFIVTSHGFILLPVTIPLTLVA